MTSQGLVVDPIVEEVRRHRQQYAERLNYDAEAILADLASRASGHDGRLVSYPPKPAPKRDKTA